MKIEDNLVARDKWIRKQLGKLKRGTKILDAGAGEQPYRRDCKHLKYFSQDISEYTGEGNSKGLQMGKWEFGKIDIVSDIVALPVKDRSFGALLCSEVLEHVEDPVRALREMCRVIDVGGKMIITAPFASLTHFAPDHYATGFNRYFYEKILAEEGFEIEEMTQNGDYFTFLAQELGRLAYMAQEYSSRPLRRWQVWIIRIVIRMCKRLHLHDKGSGELLCFGYHVLAIKRKQK